jgi:hypothetical protein
MSRKMPELTPTAVMDAPLQTDSEKLQTFRTRSGCKQEVQSAIASG